MLLSAGETNRNVLPVSSISRSLYSQTPYQRVAGSWMQSYPNFTEYVPKKAAAGSENATNPVIDVSESNGKGLRDIQEMQQFITYQATRQIVPLLPSTGLLLNKLV